MPRRGNSSDLSDRSQLLLKTLVERYIREGEPVGSRTLARDSGLDLSAATVRNVMADLEEMGLIRSPHTSAGRIPTPRGYRMFVDALLTVQSLGEFEVERMRHELDAIGDRTALVTSASNLLSEITHLASLVMVPRTPEMRLRQIEFLPLGDNRVLVILVVNEQEVQNRVIRTARTYGAAELQQSSNYINAEFSGRTLEQIRAVLVGELRDTRERMNDMMLAAVEMAEMALADEGGDDVVVAGQTNLMGYGELADMEKLRHLFEAFNAKRDILHLLDQSIHARGVQVFIGEESGYEVLDDCSVVTSTYQVDESRIGVVGVIGPTRMAYERVIPVVDLTARLLGAALNHAH